MVGRMFMYVAVPRHLLMEVIAGFEPVPCYGCTFVVPEGKYSEVKYTKNTIQSSVKVA